MFDVVEVVELCRKAAGDDVSLAGDTELLTRVQGYAAARAALDAAELHDLAELEVRGTCDREFGSNTATWVAQATGADRRSVAARVATGVKLRVFDCFDDALSDGRLSFDHARAFARAANPRIEAELAAEQSRWVELAGRVPFRAWQGELATRAELLDQDGGFDPERERARNQLTLSRTGDGVVIRGELIGELALGFTQHLEAATNSAYRRAVADHDQTAELAVPSTLTLRAEALAELVRRGATAATPGRAPAADVTVVVDQRRPGVIASPDGDLVLPEDRVGHLVCGADRTPVVIDGDGVVLHLGRTARHATPGQRRALGVRDGGCLFPGCSVPATWCDAHHVRHWEHDGTTDLPNLALLCRHHHGVTHRTGWTMTANADQTFTWTTPTGHTLDSQRHHGRPPPDP